MLHRPAFLTSIGAVCQLALGCEGPSSSAEFELELLIGLPDEVMDVTVDDPNAVVEIVPGGATRVLEARRVYPTYEIGSAAAPLSFSFIRADGSETTSAARAGACARICFYPQCPAPETITLETLQISTIVFAPFDFTCVKCEGGGERVLACE